MSTDYYKGIELTQVPTGFGIYTGLAITNSGNFPIRYSFEISETVLTGISDPKRTLFLTDDVGSFDAQENILYKTLNPNQSGILHILHKPYKIAATGYETAQITIKSLSSIGDSDESIFIDVTGHRITGSPIPNAVAKFYAIQNYDPNDKFTLDFRWSCLSGKTFITGFGIDLGLNSSFSSLHGGATKYFPVEVSAEQEVLPNYGHYSGWLGSDFSAKITNLSLTETYYARIFPVNHTGGTGKYTYATGFTKSDIITLTDKAYSGFLPSPGSNLSFTPQMLNINMSYNSLRSVDLLKLMRENNNGSNDFSFYSGANIKFNPMSVDFGRIESDSENSAALYLKQQNDIIYNTGLGGIFRLELEFENMYVLGHGGTAGTATTNPTNGGPVFAFDNLDVKDSNNNQKYFNYYIYKDVDSLFRGGVGGGQSIKITQSTDGQTVTQVINGVNISYYDRNLKQSEP